MYCENCGATVGETASFCRSCGTRLTQAENREADVPVFDEANAGSRQEEGGGPISSLQVPDQTHDGGDPSTSSSDGEQSRSPEHEQGAGFRWLPARSKPYFILAGMVMIAAIGVAYFTLGGDRESDPDPRPVEDAASTPATNQNYERCVTDLIFYAELLLTNVGDDPAQQQVTDEALAEFGFESFEYPFLTGDILTETIPITFEQGVEAGLRKATRLIEEGCGQEYGISAL